MFKKINCEGGEEKDRERRHSNNSRDLPGGKIGKDTTDALEDVIFDMSLKG